ncbi:MAG TPA: hypothetical protein VH418_18535 [Solirubrobacteraceae bacterium]
MATKARRSAARRNVQTGAVGAEGRHMLTNLPARVGRADRG